MNSDLPPSLTRFRGELEHAIRRELAAAPARVPPATGAPRGRRVAMRSGLVLATAALAVLAIVSSLAPPAVAPAWARQVLERAAAVLAPARSPGTILHVADTETLSPLARAASGYTASSASEEGWLQQGPPWNERVIMHTVGGPVLEETSAGQIYNMTTNQLYPSPRTPNSKPQYTLLPGPTQASYRLRVKLRHGFDTSTITSAEAKSIRNGTQTVAWSVTWNGHVQRLEPLVLPSRRQLQLATSQQPNPSSVTFATQLRALLASGHARVSRTTTADGKPAIEIASVHPQSGPRTTYYVNPTTYAPIELDTYGYDSSKDVTRVRFTTYETLPLAGNRRLLHFTVSSTARIDRAPADYWRAAGLPRPF